MDGLHACTDNIKWTIWLLEKEHMKLGDKSGAKDRGEIGAEGMWEHFITIHCMHMKFSYKKKMNIRTLVIMMGFPKLIITYRSSNLIGSSERINH